MAVVLVAAVGIAGVLLLGSGTSKPPRATSTANPGPSFTIDTAAPPTTDPQEAVRAALIRDYFAAWSAYDEATGAPDGGPPNSDLPALSKYMTGEELIQVQRYVIGMKAGGLTAIGPIEHRPRVASIQGTTAVVNDCYISNGHIVDAKTHALRDTPGTATVGIQSTLQLDANSGIWKLAKSAGKPELCAAS